MKKQTNTRLLSILLCVVMVLALAPTTVFAWTAPTLSGGKAEWNVQLSDEGVLTWNDMGAASYDIEVDETEMGFTYTKIVGINTNSYNLIDRLKELKTENGTYYFTIKANDLDISSGTIQFSYISPEPKLSAPLNLRWDGTVAKWDSVANATEYAVLLYSDSGNLQSSKTTTETQYDWSTNVYNDGFWFEVVAIGDNYRNSNAAEGPKYGNYTWTAPTLTGGKAEWNVTISDDGMLKWNDMGSSSYDIYVDKTEMGGTVTNIYNVNTNTYNLINHLKDIKIENGIYYFHIEANDTGATSGDIRFMYISPESKLSAPLNLRWDGTVAKWDSVANATEYTVRLYSNSGNLQLSKTTSETQYDWSTNVYNNGFWFEVIATANDYRDSHASESPKYVVISYSIGAYPYDATVSKAQAGGQVYLSTDEGTDGWSSDGYIKSATEGTTVTLNANPAAGYKFVEWRQGTSGATISTDANYQFVASENKYLYAVFETISSTTYNIELSIFDITYTAIDGGTVAIQANKGYSESGSGVIGQATENTAVTITAIPKAGYEFVAWKLWTPHNATSFSTDTTFTFNATEEIFLYAVFQEVQQIVPTYEINAVAHNLSSNEIGGKVFLETDKGGTGYATSQQKHATENTTVRLLAVAEPGYQFVAWRKGSPTDANATVSTNVEYEFTATEAVWMYAVFEYTPECTIDCSVFDITGGINNGQSGVGGTVSIQTDKGSVEGATPLPIKATRNSSVTVNAVADQGYEFLGWKKASPYVQDYVSTSPSYTFDINEELYLYAVFQEATTPEYIVSYDANGGSGTMVGDTVEENGKFTLEDCTYTAPSGYQFKAWAIGSVNGEQKQPGDQITITAETYIYAIWEEIPHSCTGTLQAGQSASCTTDGWADYYKCDCGKYYKDAGCANEITDLEAWKIGEGKIPASHSYTIVNGYKGDDGHANSCACGAHDTPVPHTPDRAEATETDPITCTECGYIIEPVKQHSHTPKAQWSKDAGYHWHECEGCDGQQLEKGAHADTDTNGKCDTCEYPMSVTPPPSGGGNVTPPPHVHNYGSSYKSDDENHWNECACGAKTNVKAHADSNEDGKCDACGYAMSVTPPHTHNYVEGKCECGATDPNYKPDEPSEPSTPTTPTEPTEPTDPTEPSDKKDGLGTGAIIAIVAVVLLAIGFAAYWFISKKKSK